MSIIPDVAVSGFVTVRSSTIDDRGLFATRRVRSGRTLVESPVLVLPSSHRAALCTTPIYEYTFKWELDYGALALGAISFANHSSRPSAFCYPDFERRTLVLVALKDIEMGQEVTIDYGEEIWFEDSQASRSSYAG